MFVPGMDLVSLVRPDGAMTSANTLTGSVLARVSTLRPSTPLRGSGRSRKNTRRRIGTPKHNYLGHGWAAQQPLS